MELFGNYTALITPFKKNLNIDYSTLRKLTSLQLEHQSNGIVALGSTAEATALDVYEKHKVMETIISETNNRIPVIAGINAFTLSDALYQANSRFLDGADALLVSPSPYIKPSQEQLYKYFEEIADKSYIPIILYNIPSRTNISLSEDIVAKLAKHPNIIGIKEASGNIAYIQRISMLTQNENFTIIAGNDDILLPMLALDTKAIISVIGNIMPSLCRETIELYYDGNFNDAKTQFTSILPLINALSCESNPSPIKYAMSKLDLCKPFHRPPLDSPSNKNKKILNKLINSIYYNN